MTFARAFALVTLSLVFSSCVAPPVLGPSSPSITSDDIRQIKFLVSQRPDIKQGVLKIWGERPDRAIIQSGSQSHDGAEVQSVHRRQSAWRVADFFAD